MGRFQLLHRDHEVGGLASHIFPLVILWKNQRKGLALADFHAQCGSFKFLEHLSVTQNELEIGRLAPVKQLAVNFSLEIHGYTIGLLRRAVERALREGAALLAQNTDGLVNGGLAHFGVHFFHHRVRQIANFYFGKHLKDRIKGHFIV